MRHLQNKTHLKAEALLQLRMRENIEAGGNEEAAEGSATTSMSAGSAAKCYAWVALPCPRYAITKFVKGLGASENASSMIPFLPPTGIAK